MRLDGERESGNVEDRRGRGGRGLVIGGGGTLIVLLVALLMGADPRALLQQLETQSVETGQTPPAAAPGAEASDAGRRFVAQVLASTEDVWREQFRQQGREYQEPTLVLFSDATESACGMAGSAVGPFYCPSDRKVYIDLGFYDELKNRFGASGEFAEAYVLAHEIGHHIQKLIGVEEKVHAAQERNPGAANHLSVDLELQADCFAGVWGHATDQRKLLDPGEVKEGLNAAAAVGDDRLQKMATGHVNPESFTHGSSEQRMDWFQKGFSTGDMSACNTFTQ